MNELMDTDKGKLNERNWFKVFIVVNILFLLVYGYANTKFSDSKHYLHMDERVTFDGVQKILHPLVGGVEYSLLGKVKKLIVEVYGSDHRYGRVHWYLSAAVSYIPEKIWGDKGVILTCRMYQLLLISLSYILLCITFIKEYKFEQYVF